MTTAKKLFQYLMMLTVMMGVFSCGDDDEPEAEPEAPAVNAIAGSYEGWAEFSMAYGTYYYDGNTLTVAANSDGTANVTLTSTSIGEYTVSNATVTKEGSTLKLAGTGKAKMSMGGHGSSTEYDCTLTATINADKTGATVAFTVPSVMGGTTITFHQGAMPSTKAVVGSYSGYCTMAMAYGNFNYDGQSLKVTENEDGTVKVVMESSQLGTYTIENATVAKGDNGYTLTGDGTANMAMGGGTGNNYDCTLSATISADKETYSFAFTIPSVMGGTTVTLLPGSAPSN